MSPALRERIDLPALPTADLGDDMGGGAETIKTDPRSLAGQFQGTPADQSGAKKRRGRDGIGKAIQSEGVGGIGDGVRGEAAIAAVAGEDRPIAKVFVVRRAVGTDATGMAEPGDADALAHAVRRHALPELIDNAHDLVPGHDRPKRHSATRHRQCGGPCGTPRRLLPERESRPMPGCGSGRSSRNEGPAGSRKNHRFHGVSPRPSPVRSCRVD